MLKGMRRLRDTFTLGMFSGLTGNMARGLFNWVTCKFKYNEYLSPEYAGSLFFKPRQTKRKLPFTVGLLADFGTGSLFGIPLVWFMKKKGKDNFLLKGAGYGIMLWIVVFGGLSHFSIFSLKSKKDVTPFSAYWEHLVYGLVASYAAVKFADPGTFPDDRLEDFHQI